MLTKEEVIENYLNKRFPYKDQIQEKNNFRKEFQWFFEYVLSETDRKIKKRSQRNF